MRMPHYHINGSIQLENDWAGQVAKTAPLFYSPNRIVPHWLCEEADKRFCRWLEIWNVDEEPVAFDMVEETKLIN